MSVARVVKVIPGRTVFFVCDLQAKFRPAIHGFDSVVATANKMLKMAKVLDVPVLVTEQNPRSLGPTVPELAFAALGQLHLGTIAKSLFTMLTPEVRDVLSDRQSKSIAIFGIESHVCVLQTTLDLLEAGYDVHVIADGVSSCNAEEVPIALERMRQAGAQITTSESIAFQLQADASRPNFKAFSSVIKDEKDSTKASLQSLLRSNMKQSML
ncbi:Isochorismatase hydrolase [Fomitopsis serialis]|uniref:Isochorismatase hydrolase n=1 Tax=Fomitopsis serialis TaxID=139415 RepID=UPI002007F340|nr:Isochorismatase hydrolase [Neoantrodia serialis]KAH9918153.1 Isochorismatase hydrolase [Neoantrodia serialis]